MNIRGKLEEFMLGAACAVLGVIAIVIGLGLCLGALGVTIVGVGGLLSFIAANKITTGLVALVISSMSVGVLTACLLMPNGAFRRASSTF